MAKGDTLLDRADIAKAMYVGAKEVFTETLKKNRREEWKECVQITKSEHKEEDYETVGNLKPAAEKVEGDPVVYGDIEDAYTTTLTNKTWANGLQVTMEAEEDETWGIVPKAKTEELARTILSLRERNVAAAWDGVTTEIGADGKAQAANDHPLLHGGGAVNDNLVAGVFGYATYEEAIKLFNNWKNHAGEKFDTMPTAMLANADRQTEILAMLQSEKLAYELSNTKNTIKKLKPIFNRYINAVRVHIIDESIKSVILQRRKGLTTEYDYDKRLTFNWFFNIHERYICGVINPGFGFVTITGV